ncbi:MAG: AMP-binding protein [Ilumatobacteraceae bacterium]
MTGNLAHLLDGHAADSIALVSRNRETTYGELREQVARARGGLAELGIGRGDRVAILCGNNRYFVVSYFAIVGLGAVAVPLNPASPAPELQTELAMVEPTAIIVGPSGASSWDGVDRSAVPTLRVVVTAESAAAETGFETLLAGAPLPPVAVGPDEPAVLLFTSGTAGRSRAAVLSHENLLANIDQSLSARDVTRPSDVVYGVLPLFHVFGLNVVLGVSFSVGATVLLVQRFDPATAVQSIIQRGVTVVPGAPPMWVAFANFDELPDTAFSGVRLALSGASRLPPQVTERFRARFGLQIHEGYGLTEAAPVVTSSVGLDAPVGSVGKVVDGVEVRVVGDDGDDVPVGDAGEVRVRGDNVFLGYWNDPDATARVLRDGWLHTGDVGVVDDAGFLYLVDRAKDLIIVSGFNVYPAEVEQVLIAHPAVRDVGVLGVPHPHDGEAVKAYVVPEPGHVADEDALVAYARQFLARYKCPTKVIFVDELPRNAAGKLVRRELEHQLLG